MLDPRLTGAVFRQTRLWHTGPSMRAATFAARSLMSDQQTDKQTPALRDRRRSSPRLMHSTQLRGTPGIILGAKNSVGRGYRGGRKITLFVSQYYTTTRNV